MDEIDLLDEALGLLFRDRRLPPPARHTGDKFFILDDLFVHPWAVGVTRQERITGEGRVADSVQQVLFEETGDRRTRADTATRPGSGYRCDP
jgi:hypothetical protein